MIAGWGRGWGRRIAAVAVGLTILVAVWSCDGEPTARPASAPVAATKAGGLVRARPSPTDTARPAPTTTPAPTTIPTETPTPTTIPTDTPTPLETITIWSPSYLGARLFFEGDVAAALRSELELELVLVEEEIGYRELQSRVETGLADGSLDADILLLPGVIADRLEAEGPAPILNSPVLADEDGDTPNPLALSLVLVLSDEASAPRRTVEAGRTSRFIGRTVDTAVEPRRGCLDPRSTTLLSYRPPATAAESQPIEFGDAVEAERVARETFDAAQKTFEDMLKEEGVKLAADWIFRKTGWLSLRFVLRGLVIFGAIDSAKSFYELAVETGGLLDDWTELDKANYRGGTQAVDEIEDLAKRAVDMIAELVDCDLGTSDAIVELEELRRRVDSQLDEVNSSADGLEGNGNSEAANSLREWADAQAGSFSETELEVSKAILAKQERIDDESRASNQSPRITSFTNLFVQEDHMNDYEVQASDSDGHDLFYRWMLLNLKCGEARGTGVQPFFGYFHEDCDFPDETVAWVVVFVYDCFGGVDWYGQPARDNDFGVPITDRRQMIDTRGENRPDSVSDTLQEIGTELEGEPCL